MEEPPGSRSLAGKLVDFAISQSAKREVSRTRYLHVNARRSSRAGLPSPLPARSKTPFSGLFALPCLWSGACHSKRGAQEKKGSKNTGSGARGRSRMHGQVSTDPGWAALSNTERQVAEGEWRLAWLGPGRQRQTKRALGAATIQRRCCFWCSCVRKCLLLLPLAG